MWAGSPSGVPSTKGLPTVRNFGSAQRDSTASFSGTPGLASKVLTGQVPVLTISFKFVPTVASKVLTGQVPALSIGFKFTPLVSSLVKTGQVPTLTIAYKFVPAVSSIVKTGQVPALSIGYRFTPAVASKVLTGFAPTLTRAFSFTPGLASIIKTGFVPILSGAAQPIVGGGWDYKRKRVIIGSKAYLVANADELNYLLLRELASDVPIVAKPVQRAKPVTVPRVIALGPVQPAKLETLTQQAEQLEQFDVLAELKRIRILMDDDDVIEALRAFRRTLH